MSEVISGGSYWEGGFYNFILFLICIWLILYGKSEKNKFGHQMETIPFIIIIIIIFYVMTVYK